MCIGRKCMHTDVNFLSNRPKVMQDQFNYQLLCKERRMKRQSLFFVIAVMGYAFDGVGCLPARGYADARSAC